jgi:hypothetical protein
MYVNIKNENYGYAVATFGDFVAVGNPGLVRYNAASPNSKWSGSVEVFIYNYRTDQHDYVATLYKDSIIQDVLLAAETMSVVSASMSTEAGKDLQINRHLYTSMFEDGYGVAVDIYDNVLAIGCPYYLQHVETSASFTSSVSGSDVDIFNLTYYQQDSFRNTASLSSSYVMSIPNPDPPLSGSFGYAVSINDGWLAVGSPYVSGSDGMVYIYRNTPTGSALSWSFQQKIVPSGSAKGLKFGYSLELNKVTSSMSGSLIVGIGSTSGSKAFLFEYVSGSWTQTYTFIPDTTAHALTFGGYTPFTSSFVKSSSYGQAVSMYNNTVVIGAPQDRIIYEYTSSYFYRQGAGYVYEKCLNLQTASYALVLKTYGDETILKNNRLGYSVGIYDDIIAIGAPKTNVDILTACFIQATYEQLHYCNSELENVLNGQVAFLMRNTSSNDWELNKIYQRKKRYLSPCRSYGFSVDVGDKSLVVGAPMMLSGLSRQINISTTQSFGQAMDDVAGKAYIYNLKNHRPAFYVGNVFYRNGKIVLMTSGSVFDGLLFNPISDYTYEYEIDFKGEHTIYEKQIVCSVNPGEFNVSTNPTAITREVPLWDINGNGYFDFQDVDVLLSYMQYKNTQFYGSQTTTTNWSSSIVATDDEKSLLAYYQSTYDSSHTQVLISESITRFEFTDTWMQDELDLNQDNKIDVNDLNIMWKHFANRLTQANYASYITPSCTRKLFSDIIDHMDVMTKKTSPPLIRSGFFDYERLAAVDKTGSFLAPVATTIGLYSGLDLVAIAKLGSPVKISPELPINFCIKMDF